MSWLKIDSQKLTAIADAIRGKTGGTEKLGLDGMADGVDAVFTKGKQAEYDRFWDAYQENGNPTYLGFMFAGAGWKPETFYPKYNIVSSRYGCTNMFYMFDYRNRNTRTPLNLEERLNELGITINLSKGFAPSNMFYMANINVVPALDFSTFTEMDSVFNNADKITTIRKLKVNENATWNYAFNAATALENITFEGTIGKNISFANSPLLTTASVQSIIDCLKDLTGQTAQTLTFHATVGGKLTDAQKATITAKNWTLVY